MGQTNRIFLLCIPSGYFVRNSPLDGQWGIFFRFFLKVALKFCGINFSALVGMLYFEQSYKVLKGSYETLNRINQLSVKVVYDSIRPFIETPPLERTSSKKIDTLAADLFSLFTADIIKANTLFTR